MSESPLELVLARLPDHRQAGNGWQACCPAHEDDRPSLSIAEGDDGRVLLRCHAGCSLDALCRALEILPVDLFPKSNERSFERSKDGPPPMTKIEAEYSYRDETGKLLFQVVRHEPKNFRQRKPKPGGGWEHSVKGVPQVPYRLPELLKYAGGTVCIVEGEKDVDNLAKLNVVATCNAGGAGKWTAEHAKHLQGRKVVILPDNDVPGVSHALQVAHSLLGVAESIRILQLPDLPPKGDVSDWIANGGTCETLKKLAEAAPHWTPELAANLPWPEIESLEVYRLPEFPVHTLPEVLRRWVSEESMATQTPAAMGAMMTLAVCASAIARRVVVVPRQGFVEPTNIYTLTLMEPANRKTKVFADAVRPLAELEQELVAEAAPRVARDQSKRRRQEAKLARLEKQADQRDDDEAATKADELAAELATRPAVVPPRLIVDDSTSEKLGIILAAQGGRIASLSPEGGVFDLMAGQNSKNGMPSFDLYLKGHSGDEIVTDRVTRESVRIARPALTCGYTVQPQVIQGLAENPTFRGRGLLARFLYAFPQSWIGERRIAPPPLSEEAERAYADVVRKLSEIPEGRKLTFDEAASVVFLAWEGEVERELGDGGAMESFRDWGGKLVGATLRLAAVLQSVEHPSETIVGASTIAAAIEIARFLIPHAEAVLDLMDAKDEPLLADARYILRWIQRYERREFTKTEVQHHGKRRFRKVERIDPPLKELERRGYIRLRQATPQGPGRPPSPVYDLNPSINLS